MTSEKKRVECLYCGLSVYATDELSRLLGSHDECSHAESEDDEENLVVGLAPVRCGHGVAHDEGCYRCAAPENVP